MDSLSEVTILVRNVFVKMEIGFARYDVLLCNAVIPSKDSVARSVLIVSGMDKPSEMDRS